MTVYAVVMAVLFLNELFCHSKGTDKYRTFSVVICGAVLLLVSGFRYLVGTDYYTYMRGFRGYSEDVISWLSQPSVNLIARLSKVIYNDYATWFFIMAMIAIIPVIVTIIRHCDKPELGIFLFVGLGCWHYSFNIVKQSAAAAIILCGYSSLINKNFRRWLIICLIAATFHFSALLMIPVYFLVNKKNSIWLNVFIFGLGIILLLFYDRLFDIASFLKGGQNTVLLYSHTRNDSVNILRVLVNFAPGLLLLLYRKNFDYDDVKFNVLMNMSLLNMALNIAAMNSIYLYRICAYTNIFNILFYPALLKKIMARDRIIITLTLIVLFTVFWWHDLSVGTSLSEFHWIFER